ncbi:MAG: tetratricopeptide repeat protein [candidate division WOR-3 bacterium]
MLKSLVLNTKFLPPRFPESVLYRTRLLDPISKNISKKLILLCAGPGYGKTTLVSTLLESLKFKFLWYNIDNNDRELDIFLIHLIYGIKSRFSDFGEKTLAALEIGDPVKNFPLVITTFINEICAAIQEDFYIIFDDYQHVSRLGPINRLFEYLFDYLPSNIHIIMTTRDYPAFSLTRLRARGELYEIHTPELKFTLEETIDFYRGRIPIEELRGAWEYFEGWITGIQFFIHLPNHKKIIPSHLTEETVFDYFATEVLAQQPVPIQNFLVNTSILDWLSPDVCNHILKINNSAEYLNYLVTKNLFIEELINKQKVYRYHRLFKEFLTKQLQKEGPEVIKSLNRDAAKFFEKNRDLTNAIMYYLEAGELKTAASIIIKNYHRDMVTRGWSGHLTKWLNKFPREFIESDPWLLFIKGSILMETGYWDESFDHYYKAQRLFTFKNHRLGMSISNYRLSILFKRRGDQKQALRFSRKALNLVPGKEKELKALIINSIGALDLTRGRYRGLARRFNKAYLLVRGENSRPEAIILTNLGLISQITGDLDRAREYYQRAIMIGEKAVLPGISIIYNNLATIKMLTGEFEEARKLLEKSRSTAQNYGDQRALLTTLIAWSEFYLLQNESKNFETSINEAITLNQNLREKEAEKLIDLLLGRYYLKSGDNYNAHRCYTRARDTGSGFILVQALLGLGVIEMTIHHFKKAHALFLQGVEITKKLGMKYFITDALLHLAKLGHRINKSESVRKYLSQALNLARQKGYEFLVLNHFQDNGFYLIIEAIKSRICPEYIHQILKRSKIEIIMNLIKVNNPQVQNTARKIFTRIALQRGYYLKIDTSETLKILIAPDYEIPVKWHSQKQKSLFAYLITHPGLHHQEKLAEYFWPSSSPNRSLANLRSSITHLNAQFNFCPRLINRIGQNYGINEKYPMRVDCLEFQNLCNEAKILEKSNIEEAIKKYESTLNAYPANFLNDNFDNWAEDLRSHLKRLYHSLLTNLVDYHSKTGDYHEAVRYLLEIIALEPFYEENYHRLFKLYARIGDLKSIREKYHQMQATFLKELKRAPSTKTTELVRTLTE